MLCLRKTSSFNFLHIDKSAGYMLLPENIAEVLQYYLTVVVLLGTAMFVLGFGETGAKAQSESHSVRKDGVQSTRESIVVGR